MFGNSELTVILALLSPLGIILGAVWGFAIWMSRQFATLKDLIYTKIDALEKTLLNKLEYHERHDDTRFSEVHRELWEIKLRNAAIEGLRKIETKKEI